MQVGIQRTLPYLTTDLLHPKDKKLARKSTTPFSYFIGLVVCNFCILDIKSNKKIKSQNASSLLPTRQNIVIFRVEEGCQS